MNCPKCNADMLTCMGCGPLAAQAVEGVASLSYGWAYHDPNLGWVSGGQDFTSRGHCVGKALRHAQLTGMKVQLSTMATVTVVEDLPLPGQP